MDIVSLDLLQQLVPLAPWAGAALVAAICMRITGDTPSQLLQAVASLLWGWRRK